MTKPARTATADLYVDYGHFSVTDYGADVPELRPAYANGLVGADSSGASVLTGTATGEVTVTVQLLDAEPGSIELDSWDEVSEVSLDSAEGFLLVHNMMDGPPRELGELAYVGPGTYRLRVHARGRDIAPHSHADTPREHYQISAWPAPETPPTVHKQTDRYGHEVRARETEL
ncbi:hypothetical protein L3Q65_13850 [Amycolatopsis sp. FU40]|uniref:hypothetical protein n=1 Tax=Amycolatopsis sp. FU40 TaxID=2914159 RepID=UPI001F2EA98D|nr:hypothetical protein [Amycolatopsis sp. FU40]UKD57759.1 hypothetical protein L3Q65_13850 [Amycolatopsis sp. FU40]